ncbi:hypothetical protein BD770DRAFT_395815 [Pilaira anomala]|nr:hypothetical protein BD770DRAFT_395815 [Pilaira anomala]
MAFMFKILIFFFNCRWLSVILLPSCKEPLKAHTRHCHYLSVVPVLVAQLVYVIWTVQQASICVGFCSFLVAATPVDIYLCALVL